MDCGGQKQENLVDFHLGGGSWNNAAKTWNKVKRYKEYVATDGNANCHYVLPKDKHINGRSETAYVEALNSRLRDCLARLNRRTKKFSKSIHMLKYFLCLWMMRYDINIIDCEFIFI